MLKNFFRTAALAVVFAGGFAATQASAATVLSDGDTVTISGGLETEFVGNVIGNGSSGSWSVNFEATDSGNGSAEVTIGGLVAGNFAGLVMSWINTDTLALISSVAIVPVSVSLDTLFVDPTSLNQTLEISWDRSIAGTAFDVEIVAAVPIPAAGFLLVGALGGLGFVGRRRKKTS